LDRKGGVEVDHKIGPEAVEKREITLLGLKPGSSRQ
jgi:hypothetical protein